jgi:hypothetical protein
MTSAFHNTNPFCDPEFMQTHGSHASQQLASIKVQWNSCLSLLLLIWQYHRAFSVWCILDVYDLNWSLSCNYLSQRPHQWTIRLDLSLHWYFCTPYSYLRRSLQFSNWWIQRRIQWVGGSIGTAPIVKPTTTAWACAEPPLLIYSNTSTPTSVSTRNETGWSETRPSGNTPPIVSSLYEDQQGGTSQGSSFLGTPTVFDQEESVSRAGGNVVKELPRESGTGAKQNLKGLLSRLNNLLHKSVTESRTYGSC